MKVEETNFVTHLIFSIQLYYWLSKIPSVKIWSNKFQMVMINYGKLCASLYENLMSEFYVNWAKVRFCGCEYNLKIRSCCHGNYDYVKFYLSIKNFHQYIFHLPSFSLWAATFLLPWLGKWHITHKLPKLCSATLIGVYLPQQYGSPNERNFRSLIIIVQEGKEQNLSLESLSLCRELGKGCAHFPIHRGYLHYLRPNFLRWVIPVLPILANSCFLFASCNRL